VISELVASLRYKKGTYIDYFYESRRRGEPAPVEDVHFHPAEADHGWSCSGEREGGSGAPPAWAALRERAQRFPWPPPWSPSRLPWPGS